MITFNIRVHKNSSRLSILPTRKIQIPHHTKKKNFNVDVFSLEIIFLNIKFVIKKHKFSIKFDLFSIILRTFFCYLQIYLIFIIMVLLAIFYKKYPFVISLSPWRSSVRPSVPPSIRSLFHKIESRHSII